MASVNRVILIGNLGADPEVKTFDNGGKIANVSIATTDRWTDRNTGEQKEAVEWHRVVFNDRLADIVAQYLRKGSQVYVEGSIKTRKWTDQQGIERYTTEIRATSMQMLGSRTDGGQQAQNGYGQAPQGQGYQGQQSPQGYPQPQNGGYAPPQPPQGQAQRQPAPQQGYQSQQANGYNKGFAHPSEAGYQNDGYGNLVPITPQGGVPDDDMPF